MVCVFILKGCRRFLLKLHCWVRAFFRFRMLEMLTKGVLFTLLPLSPLGHWSIKYPTCSHKSRTTGCRPEPPESASGSWWAPSLSPTRRPTAAPKKSSQRQALAKETWDSDTSYNVSGCIVFFFNVLSNIKVVKVFLSKNSYWLANGSLPSCPVYSDGWNNEVLHCVPGSGHGPHLCLILLKWEWRNPLILF